MLKIFFEDQLQMGGVFTLKNCFFEEINPAAKSNITSLTASCASLVNIRFIVLSYYFIADGYMAVLFRHV